MRISLLLLPMMACEAISDKIDQVTDDFGDITNENIVAGAVLGVDQEQSQAAIDTVLAEELCLPEDQIPVLDEEMTAQTNQAMVFLSKTDVAEDIFNGGIEQLADAAPITGAVVTLTSASGDLNQLSIPETETQGSYVAGVADNFTYVEEQVVFDIAADRESLMIRVDAPPAADLSSSIATEQPLNTPLTVDLRGQGFHSALALVMKLPTEEGQEPTVTYSNLSMDDPVAMFELTHPSGSLLNEDIPEYEEIEIPAEAFAENGVYAVGVSGLRVSSKEDQENINLMSAMIAGKFSFKPVCAPNCDTVKEEVLCSSTLIDAAYQEIVDQIPDLNNDGQPDTQPPVLDDALRAEICTDLLDLACSQ